MQKAFENVTRFQIKELLKFPRELGKFHGSYRQDP